MAIQLQKFSAHLLLKNRFRLHDQLVFLQRLHRLTDNGYPLQRALETIQWDVTLAPRTKIISHALQHGLSIDQALAEAGFSENVISYFYFARSTGDLTETIKQCTEMLQRQMEYMKRFQQTARYPIVLLFLCTVLLFFIKNTVYPSFTALFASAGQTSILTNFSIFFINLLFHSFIISFFLGTCFSLGWLFIKPKLNIETQIALSQKLPVYRGYLRLQTTFLFSLHISSLLKTGMPLKDALHILHQQKRLPVLAYYAELIEQEIEKGIQLVHIISVFPLFEKGLADVFQKNLNNQTLQNDLRIYAEFLTEQMEAKIKKTIALLQPAVFFLLAGLIIFVYLSLMLPMFQLIDTI